MASWAQASDEFKKVEVFLRMSPRPRTARLDATKAESPSTPQMARGLCPAIAWDMRGSSSPVRCLADDSAVVGCGQGKPKEKFQLGQSSALAAFVVSFTKHTHISELMPPL